MEQVERTIDGRNSSKVNGVVDTYAIVSNSKDGCVIAVKSGLQNIKPQLYCFDSKAEAELWIAEQEAYTRDYGMYKYQ